jgi:hypothetical protein
MFVRVRNVTLHSPPHVTGCSHLNAVPNCWKHLLIQSVPLTTKPVDTGWLVGGPLLRVATTSRTTDTFLFISHLRTYSFSNLVAIASLVFELQVLTLSVPN